MPYPPHVQLDENDMITRILFCGFAVIAFLIPLCVEATYAADEKFIGVNVSLVLAKKKLLFEFFLVVRNLI